MSSHGNDGKDGNERKRPAMGDHSEGHDWQKVGTFSHDWNPLSDTQNQNIAMGSMDYESNNTNEEYLEKIRARARETRKRKKQFFEELQREVLLLSRNNAFLRKQNEELECAVKTAKEIAMAQEAQVTDHASAQGRVLGLRSRDPGSFQPSVSSMQAAASIPLQINAAGSMAVGCSPQRLGTNPTTSTWTNRQQSLGDLLISELQMKNSPSQGLQDAVARSAEGVEDYSVRKSRFDESVLLQSLLAQSQARETRIGRAVDVPANIDPGRRHDNQQTDTMMQYILSQGVSREPNQEAAARPSNAMVGFHESAPTNVIQESDVLQTILARSFAREPSQDLSLHSSALANNSQESDAVLQSILAQSLARDQNNQELSVRSLTQGNPVARASWNQQSNVLQSILAQGSSNPPNPTIRDTPSNPFAASSNSNNLSLTNLVNQHQDPLSQCIGTNISSRQSQASISLAALLGQSSQYSSIRQMQPCPEIEGRPSNTHVQMVARQNIMDQTPVLDLPSIASLQSNTGSNFFSSEMVRGSNLKSAESNEISGHAARTQIHLRLSESSPRESHSDEQPGSTSRAA